MEFLSNPWVVGIVGGVLSGLLVTLITRYLFSKRERREYLQKVATANNEIIYAIRPAIAEKVIPSNHMLEALFSATARKYSVDEADLYSKVGLANELMKEVMDNTFLSSQQKVEFCDLLSTLKEARKSGPEVHRVVEYVRVNRGNSSDTSAMLGLVTAMMAVVTTMFVYLKDKEDFLSEGLFGLPSKLLPMILIISTVPIMAVFLKDFLKKIRALDPEIVVTRRKEPNEKTEQKSEEKPNKSMQPTASASAD
ncbi:hypothetical protein JD489_10235 [Aeromonas veronii]|uniref:hypothetical protein n=1 Tax=Aeromonas veronii TaxID=654 RepID=UPI00191E786B|nr:hypothetical protein [Aeromonas veronii]MBL0477686.1 hypothetical protein [Aeromonas veronii]